MRDIKLDELVRLLLAHEQHIEAVKLVKEETGRDLKRAKRYVDGLARSAPPMQPEGRLPPGAISNLYKLLALGRDGSAVERVIEKTGWDRPLAQAYVGALTHSAPRLSELERFLAELSFELSRLLARVRKRIGRGCSLLFVA